MTTQRRVNRPLPRWLVPDPRPYKDWSLTDMEIVWNIAHHDLGNALMMEPGPDREFIETFSRQTIALLTAERQRRERAGQPGREEAKAEAGRYSPAFIKRIKESFDLRDVIAHDLGLSKPINGAICSPLRDDEHPSFAVYSDRFHDFATHEGGDIFRWRMVMNPGITFWQCVESLAIEAGLDLPDDDAPRPAAPRRPGKARQRHEFKDGKVVTRE